MIPQAVAFESFIENPSFLSLRKPISKTAFSKTHQSEIQNAPLNSLTSL